MRRLAQLLQRPLAKVLFALLLLFTAWGSAQAQDSPDTSLKAGSNGMSGAQVNAVTADSLANDYLAGITNSGGRFSLGTTGGDPDSTVDDNRRLLYGFPYEAGTSVTTVRVVAGAEVTDYRLGSGEGEGVTPVAPPKLEDGVLQTEFVRDGTRITQRLYFSQNPDTGRQDAITIEYILKNEAASSRQVGVRLLLDTMIGDNDGAPFFVEGIGRTTQQFDWTGANVPAYWLAYESPTFEVSSLKGRGQLSGPQVTRPDRLVIADWNQAQGTYWDYTVDPVDAVTNDSAVLLYFNPVALAPGASRVVRASYGIAPATTVQTIEVTGIEVTQGIQNLRNAVSLIENRPTVARVHVRTNGGTASDVRAELIGTRNGSALPGSPLTPANRNGAITGKFAPVRTQLDDSFYFHLPDSWLNGTVNLEVRAVGSTFGCADVTGAADDCRAQVVFAAAPAPEVRLVGITWRDNGTLHTPAEADYREVERQLEAIFPVPQLVVGTPYAIEPAFLNGPPASAEEWARINNLLAVQRILDGCLLGCNRYYVGVLVDQPGTVVMDGLAAGVPGVTASGFVTPDFNHAHQLAHSTGSAHVVCAGDETNPGQFPFPGGQIGGPGDENERYYGFDTTRNAIYGPNSGDLMSYCAPRWISAYTYNAIGAALAEVYGNNPLPPPALRTGDPAILVAGEIALRAWGGTFRSVYSLPAPGAAALPAAGAYTVSLRSATGAELAAYAFAPAVASEGEIATFALLLPKPPGTAEIVLLHDGRVLDSRATNTNPPSVTVLAPNGGEQLAGVGAPVTWSASDPDNDPLLFALQYSPNGGLTWQTVVADFGGTTYSLPLATLPGGANSLVRVIASDGLYSSSDVSDGPFSVPTHPPVAAILAPAAGSQYVGSQAITLIGSGRDIEDGTIADAASFAWATDRGGALGNGRTLSLNAANLAAGRHVITLTVTDSDGQTATASVTITVSRLPVVVPPGWQITPNTLYFAANAGGAAPDTQLLSIRSSGDTELQWTATDDQPWLSLSSLGASTPSDILVGVNPHNTAGGVYTGTIVFSSPQVNQPYTVTVRFEVTDLAPAQIEVTPSTVVLIADGQSQAQIVATVKNSRGTRLPNQVVSFATSQGSITPSAVTDARGVATGTLTAGTVVAVATVTATASAVSDVTDLLMSTGPAAALSLARGAPSEPTGGESGAFIIATITDALGRPVENQAVSFSTSVGTITPETVTNAAGKATALLTAPENSGTATVRAVTGAMRAELAVDLGKLYSLLLPFVSR